MFLRTTISNWRWWLLLPLILAMLPVVIAIKVLHLMRDACDTTADALERGGSAVFDVPFQWWKKSAKRIREKANAGNQR